jgi:hypothetical protein
MLRREWCVLARRAILVSDRLVIGQPVRSLVLLVAQSQFPVCILHDSNRQCYVSRQMATIDDNTGPLGEYWRQAPQSSEEVFGG